MQYQKKKFWLDLSIYVFLRGILKSPAMFIYFLIHNKANLPGTVALRFDRKVWHYSVSCSQLIHHHVGWLEKENKLDLISKERISIKYACQLSTSALHMLSWWTIVLIVKVITKSNVFQLESLCLKNIKPWCSNIFIIW